MSQDHAKHSPARIAQRGKASQAVSLRARGLPWAEVARLAEYPSPDAARVAVARTLDRVEADNVDDLRAEEDAHLLLLRQSAMPAAMDGDPASLAVLLRISDSRRKLHGIDLPASHTVNIRREEADLADQLATGLNEMIERERDNARQDGLRQAHFPEGGADHA
ncbi:Hypothetical protein CGLY_15605 [Corynebacterium glyciniphilum AJ 3170]|uniref:Uncharacterized protein n=1 Tax=Corynebacterium glyciniphilum AJ 3170 TaxID=1404245 RepID=X5DY77_9CORY|nr:hypothetical protein [Corynebacterium glyciniphilum]AHW65557.1 Hypothetical protein CGLY_15605 [Corynebacterium glyciniphilum AJ 3170]